MHRGRVMVLLGHDHVDHELEAALDQPFPDEAGQAKMIMLDDKRTHAGEV